VRRTKPATGYSVQQSTNDLFEALNALKLQQVLLVGQHVEGADADRVVAKSRQERDGVRRDAGIGQEAHESGAKRMQLVLGQGRRVAKRLPDVHQVEIGQIHDDLLRGHAVGHEVHDVRNRDP
jgi:hypothetical protein